MSQALLLVDIQNDYFAGGAMALPGSASAGDRAARLLRSFRQKSAKVVHIQHVSSRPGATFFLPGTKGAEIHDGVAPVADEVVFRKSYPNSFRGTPLLAHLREHQVTQLVIAGMMTQMCIDTTTRAATDLGFRCVLAHDACAARALSFGGTDVAAELVHAAFVAALDGLFAKARSVDDLCASL